MQIGQAQAPGKIAEPIPLEAADSAKKNLYGALAEDRLAALASEGKTPPEPEPVVESVRDPATPTEVDKQAFLRAVLGDKSYEKVYTLFNGTVEITLVDRRTRQTEHLYDALRKLQEELKFPEGDWTMWEERFLLASTLRKVRFRNSSVKEYAFSDDLKGRVLELMEFSKPVYLALMETSRLFERQVQILTDKANDVGFWRADGNVSR